MRPGDRPVRGHPAVALVREAAASARSQIVASTLLVLVVAGMLVAIASTTGRAAAAQRQVLQVIDLEDTRSITVRASADAGLTADLITAVGGLSGVDWVIGVGPAEDGFNRDRPGGQAVGVRRLYASTLDPLHLTTRSPLTDAAYVDPAGRALLGFAEPAGAISVAAGRTYPVVGLTTPPENLTRGEPMALIPATPTSTAPLVGMTVQASGPEHVAPLLTAVASMAVSPDPTKVTIESSSRLAALRASVDANLASFGRELLSLILTAAAALVSLILIALVQLRRRDFGRRRALGATRGMIIALLLVQVVLLVLTGQALGIAVTIALNRFRGEPLPGWDFFLATGYLCLLAATAGALIPAVIASRRDPLKELRTP